MKRVASRDGTAFAVPFRLETKGLVSGDRLPPDVISVLKQGCFSCPGSIRERIEKMAVDLAETEVSRTEFDYSRYRDQVLEQLKSELKEGRKNQISAHNLLVFQIMRSLDSFNMGRFFPTPASFVRPEAVDPSRFPRGFPHQLRAQAEAIVIGKLKDSIGQDEYIRFLAQRFTHNQIKEIQSDLKFAGEKNGRDFASLMFELRGLSVAPTINELLLKEEVKRTITDKTSLPLIHIKSLRYTYPEGKKLEVLEHLDRVVSPGIGQETRTYPSEKVIFERLSRLVGLFRHYGVEANLTVLVADNDLEILFPEGNSLVSQAEVQRARLAARRYVQNVKANNPRLADQIHLLTEYLHDSALEDRYALVVDQVLREVRAGGRELLEETVIERRVEYQFEHYQAMFGRRYSRTEARFTAYNQIAISMVLSVVFESFPRVPIVVIDDRGQENNLIGGYKPDSAAIFLAKLKDRTVIKEKC